MSQIFGQPMINMGQPPITGIAGNAINPSVPVWPHVSQNTGAGSAAVPYPNVYAVPYPNKYKVEFAQIALQGLIASDANCLFTNPELASKALYIAEAMYNEALRRGLA